MLHRMAGVEDISALRSLADVVEPVKDYARFENVRGTWDFRAPLNRLIDVANPESETGRHFQVWCRDTSKAIIKTTTLKLKFAHYFPRGVITTRS